MKELFPNPVYLSDTADELRAVVPEQVIQAFRLYPDKFSDEQVRRLCRLVRREQLCRSALLAVQTHP